MAITNDEYGQMRQTAKNSRLQCEIKGTTEKIKLLEERVKKLESKE